MHKRIPETALLLEEIQGAVIGGAAATIRRYIAWEPERQWLEAEYDDGVYTATEYADDDLPLAKRHFDTLHCLLAVAAPTL